MVPLLPSGMHLIKRLCLIGMMAVWGTAASLAKEQPSDIPAWLRSHIGDGEGQIARVVLQRARALYLKKVAAASSKIPATSPWTRRAPTRADWRSGSTRSAKPTNLFARSPRVTAAAAT